MLIRFIIASICLIFACMQDLKYRRVPNYTWIPMIVAGIIFLIIELMIERSPESIIVVSIVVLLFYLLYRCPIWLLLGLVIFLNISILFLGFSEDLIQLKLIGAIFVMISAISAYMIFKLRNRLRFKILGGADAKALMCIQILMPFTIKNIPLSMLSLFNAIIITILLTLCIFIYNMIKRDIKFPECMLGYNLELPKIDLDKYWILRRPLFKRPDKLEEIELLEEWRSRGIRKVWVTPKVPFILPITIGLFLSCISFLL